jgi:hypothetical protein
MDYCYQNVVIYRELHKSLQLYFILQTFRKFFTFFYQAFQLALMIKSNSKN